nr:MAG TPA: hypothetical protein [Caudoviricetes sp.]
MDYQSRLTLFIFNISVCQKIKKHRKRLLLRTKRFTFAVVLNCLRLQR